MSKQASLLAELRIPLLIIIPIVLVLLPSGLPNTADGLVHFIRTAEMRHAWQDGVFLPRWSANLGYGYGIPLFIYAPPLPYFLGAFFHTLGVSLDTAIKLTWITGFAIASAGSYFLARHTLGVMPATVCAVAYVYAPMRLRELILQGNLGQFMAWAFLPVACWGVVRLFQTGQKRFMMAIAFGLMGSLLSHNAVALMLALMLAVLTMVLFIGTRNLYRTVWVIIGGVLGLGLSAWFWVPALLEGEFVQLFHITNSDFRDRFVPLSELIALSPPIDTGSLSPYFPLTLGAIQVWLALLGGALSAISFIIYLLLGKRKTPIKKHNSEQGGPEQNAPGVTLFFLCFTIFSAFMALQASEPIWDRLPFVALFEFPARWHGVTLVGLAWLCGLAVERIGRIHRRAEAIAGTIAMGVLMASALVNLYPQQLPPNHYQSGPRDVVRYEVEQGIVGTTSLGEFNPIWVTDGIDPTGIAADYFAGRPINRIQTTSLPKGATVVTQSDSIEHYQFYLDVSVDTQLTLNLHYFPGWKAALSGDEVDLEPEVGSGLATLALPAGQHKLEVTFSDTPLRSTADLVSLASWLILGIGVIVGQLPFFKKQASQNSTHIHQPPQTSTWVSLLTIIGVIIVARHLFSGLFRTESPPGVALPAQVQQAVDFGDEVRLLGLDPAVTLAQPGETVSVTAYWQARYDLQTNYAVFLHLDTPAEETIATVDEGHPSEIPTSHWPPTLYHRNPLGLVVPPNAAPIRYSLRLGLYDPKSGTPLMLQTDTVSQSSFEVGQVWVDQPNPELKNDGPLAQYGQAIKLLDVDYQLDAKTITLYWETTDIIEPDYSIFLHFLDDQGMLIGQADGTPFQNQYPTSAWRVGQIIEDIRLVEAPLDAVTQFAVGIYHPADGIRLPATGPAGQSLANDALVIPLLDQ
ncbi:MAG: 6-pyruvoyl-tetrahydropterin synthase-related protein [Chloroflexota bacterium]